MSQEPAARRARVAAYAIVSLAWAIHADAAGPAPMTFNWGERLEAGVKAVVNKSSGGQQQQMEVTYSLCAKRTAKNYEVGFANLSMTMGSERAPDALARTTGITGGIVPYANITHAGKFEGLRDFDQLQADVRSLYRQQLPPNADPQKVEFALAQMTGRQVLESAANRSWQSLVEIWAGLTLAPGESRKTKSPPQMMPLVNMPIAYDVDLSYPAREACTSGAKTKDCARLHYAGESDKQALTAALETLRKQFAGPSNTLPLSAALHDEAEVLTEPATLRPHWARWSRTMTGTMGDPQHPTTLTQTDAMTLTFDYAPQPACRAGKKTGP